MKSRVREHLLQVKGQIKDACARSARREEEVTLIAVSKTQPSGLIREAYDAGVRDFGENKVQEILEKARELPSDIRWHMIGHLQKNKVRHIIDKVVLIHSVDSVELAAQIEKEAAKRNLFMDILLEVNVAEEASKYGFKAKEVPEAIQLISRFSHIRLKGLMTIAPFVEYPELNRDVFKKLYQLCVDINRKNTDNMIMRVLSMGMTGDYQVAVEEGATMIRVGTGIFGTRTKIGENLL